MVSETVNLPAPGPEEVRLRHTAIGVNFLDIYHRSGVNIVPLPSGVGVEAAGEIVAVGDRVSDFKAGDRVAYAGSIGAYSDERNIAARTLVKIPNGVGDEAAAALLLKGMTAQFLVTRTYCVKAGDTILVHAAAGGVGSILCQWAKHLGATVIGTVGSEEKVATARTNGCDEIIVLDGGDFSKQVRVLTAGAGVPVVYESIGKDTYLHSLDCLKKRGLLANFGNSSGPIPPFDCRILAAKGSLYLTRPTLPDYVGTANELAETASDLFRMVASKVVHANIGARHSLAEASIAHAAMEERRTTGSTILIP